MDQTSPVDLRCSAVIFRGDRLLLVHRERDGYWVLPGGFPRPSEGMAACVRREVQEETGVRAQPSGCAFILEAIDPEQASRVVDLVFMAKEDEPVEPVELEEGLLPTFVRLDDLGAISLRPPIAGHIRALHADSRRGIGRYLGNLWRPYLQTS